MDGEEFWEYTGGYWEERDQRLKIFEASNRN